MVNRITFFSISDFKELLHQIVYKNKIWTFTSKGEAYVFFFVSDILTCDV